MVDVPWRNACMGLSSTEQHNSTAISGGTPITLQRTVGCVEESLDLFRRSATIQQSQRHTYAYTDIRTHTERDTQLVWL